jgi:hypothetical protein
MLLLQLSVIAAVGEIPVQLSEQFGLSSSDESGSLLRLLAGFSLKVGGPGKQTMQRYQAFVSSKSVGAGKAARNVGRRALRVKDECTDMVMVRMVLYWE